jgi:hypothetical protein
MLKGLIIEHICGKFNATTELLVYNGWILMEKINIPVMTSKPAAAKVILKFVKCRCKKACIPNKCSYRSSTEVGKISLNNKKFKNMYSKTQ